MPPKNKKIKIFDHCWHVTHQRDMIEALQDDCEFYFCINASKQWPSKFKFPNLNFVTHYDPNTYDLAILHVDQRSISPWNMKGIVYSQFNEVITDIPKVVINHGTPVYAKGFIYPEDAELTLTESERQNIAVSKMKKLIGQNTMVVNSYAAASSTEWGFGIPIVHGISHENWLDEKKEPRVFTAVSPGGMDEYYNREFLEKVKEELFNKYHYTLWHANNNISLSENRERYASYLGSSLLYLDTSYRTPMNRSRTEAFLSGCCVLQIEGAHDLEIWAEHDKNIFILPHDHEKIAAIIADFIENRYQDAIRIGQCGKEMAIRQFSPSSYRENWLNLISKLLKK